MMEGPPRRRWGDAYALSDLLEEAGGGVAFAVRDFALVALAIHLSHRFPEQIVFKGGFVLRHVHGLNRFSEDVDATRHNPARHKLDADEVARAIREASEGDTVRFVPGKPATDSARGLDFDSVRVTGSLLPEYAVQFEISYREGMVDEPETALIGPPYYDDFPILAMTVPEMVAEKLRALAQRVRVTDLADLAEMVSRNELRDEDIARLARAKFELVKQGAANRARRIEEHLLQMAAEYDDVVPTLFPGARRYEDAISVVWPRVRPLIP